MLPNLFGRVTAVLGEHAQLQGLLKQLQDIANAGDRRADGDLSELVRGFHQKLLEHFEAEEGDYFKTLVAAAPGLNPEVARLRDEHVLFRSIAQRLAQFAESNLRSDEFNHTLRDFLDRFDAHEHAEHVLLEQFFHRSKDD